MTGDNVLLLFNPLTWRQIYKLFRSCQLSKLAKDTGIKNPLHSCSVKLTPSQLDQIDSDILQ